MLAFEVIEAHTVAVSCMDALGPPSGDAWLNAYASLPRAEFPNLTSAGQLLYADPDERFDFGLELLLDAIERRIEAGRGTSPADDRGR